MGFLWFVRSDAARWNLSVSTLANFVRALGFPVVTKDGF